MIVFIWCHVLSSRSSKHPVKRNQQLCCKSAILNTQLALYRVFTIWSLHLLPGWINHSRSISSSSWQFEWKGQSTICPIGRMICGQSNHTPYHTVKYVAQRIILCTSLHTLHIPYWLYTTPLPHQSGQYKDTLARRADAQWVRKEGCGERIEYLFRNVWWYLKRLVSQVTQVASEEGFETD